MTSPRDPFGGLEGPEPSEITEAFRTPQRGLPPPPGAFQALRRRAAARRRRRVLAAGASVAVCLAGVAVVVAVARPVDDEQGSPVAGDGTAPTGEPSPQDSEPSEPPEPPEPSEPSESAEPTDAAEPGDAASDTAAPPRCAAHRLQLAAGPAEGAAGSLLLPLEFTNTGEELCTLTGHPEVELVTEEAGEPLGRPAEPHHGDGGGDGGGVPVRLAPGETARADLRVARAEHHDAEACAPAEAGGLRVRPPGGDDALFLPREGLTGCAADGVALLTVTAFSP